MRVVIVGGGFGGVKTALELSNKPGVEVTLLTQHANFEYHGALYRSATGHSPKEVVIPLKEIFAESKNIEVILDTVVKLESESQQVCGEMGECYPYDFVVFAMGNVVNYFGIEGMEANSLSMDNIASTFKLRSKLIELFSQKSQKTAKVVVIGAGPSGVELAGELPYFSQLIAKKHNVPARKLEVTVVEGADRVLQNLDEKVSRRVENRFKKLGIKTRLKTRVESCEVGKVCVSGKDLDADLIIWTAGSSPVHFYAEHPQDFQLERGKVKVDTRLRSVGNPHVYVVGDNAFTPYSGMAQTALYDGEYVAKDILANQKGSLHRAYKPKPPIYVVPVGPGWAVYQKDKKVRSGSYGWAIRRKADLEIFRAFEPYKNAIKLWRAGNRKSISL